MSSKLNSPELVTSLVADLVADTARRLKSAGKLDLREYQTQLHQIATTIRNSRPAQARQAKLRRQAQRLTDATRETVKVGDLKVVDTRKSHDGTRLYFELSNGQAVRADRCQRLQNPGLRKTVEAEILANANRAGK
jgi:hypothetical protein